MYTYTAKVEKIVDGDTIDVNVDLGFATFRKERLRFARINAWETRGAEKEQGKLAKARVIELIPVGTTITIKTFRDKKGKYGRYIAEIIIEDGKNLNDILLNEGHARLYNKGKI